MPIRTAMVDIDGTLVDDKLSIFEGASDKLEEWGQKYTLVCWSNTGGEYARKVLEKHDLLKYFMKDMEVYLPREKKWVKAQVPLVFDKPDIIVDNDPDSIYRSAAIIVIKGSDDWKKEDGELFCNSRKHIKEYL